MLSPLVPRANNPQTDLTIRDFKADRALGRASLFGEIANAAATKICGLYGKSPSTLVRTIPFGSGLIDNSRGVFDDLCEDIAPLPPPPSSQFTGGQCDAARYTGTYSLTEIFIDSGNIATRNNTGGFSVWGAISGISLSNSATRSVSGKTIDGFASVVVTCRGQSSQPIAPLGPVTVRTYDSSALLATSVQITSIVREGGAPDNCGNPAPSYPAPIATPPDLGSTAIINIAPNVPITVPVTIVPTFAPTANIFKPEFNIDVGGINVNISPNGFTFSPTVEIPVNLPYPYSDPRSVKPPSIAINLNGGGGGSECDLTEVIDRLIDIEDEVVRCCDRDSPHSPPQANKVLSQEYLMAGSIFQSLPARTFQVTVDVLTRPESEKFQAGGVSAPTVLYAGWFWFAAGNHMSDRMPIDAEFKIFSPPERITDSFACSMKGYTAKIVAYYINPEAE